MSQRTDKMQMATNSSLEQAGRLYGPLWWGLDSCFWAAMQLDVRDIHRMETFPEFPDICRYHNHPVRNVRVLGYVVSVHLFANRQLFQVDDGTGVVSCVQWVKELAQDKQGPGWSIQLGVLAYVCGRLSTYKESRQITVSNIYIEDDIMNEPLWWMRTRKLKEDMYGDPFAPVDDTDKSPIKKRPNEEESIITEEKFQKIVQSFLAQSGMTSFKYQTLIQTDLTEMATKVVNAKNPPGHAKISRDSRVKNLFRRTIGNLVESGMVFLSDEERDVYTIVTHSDHICPAIIEVVRKYDTGKGVAMDEILRQTKAKRALLNVPNPYLRRTVHRMINSSDLYESRRGAYKWVGGGDEDI
eukprot:CFRG1121T1